MTTGLFKDKKILVTGGTGSIGSEIVRSLQPYHPSVIRILSNDENAMSEIRPNNIQRRIIGDIRNDKKLERAMEDIDIVFHAAALKHVDLCEYNTDEAIDTNILGTRNVIDAAFHNNVEKVINISTDKAVYPISLMGATKMITEKQIKNANEGKGDKRTVFASVRFGNVIGSRGSVLRKWEQQAKEGFIEITDPEMTRYMMTTQDAVKLIFKAARLMKGGEIFILKMPIVRLGDLADQYYPGVERRVVGLRPGERMHETLMTDEEAMIAVEEDDMFVIPWTGAKL